MRAYVNPETAESTDMGAICPVLSIVISCFDYSASNTLPNGTSNARWDFNGANGNQTGKNLIEITVLNYTPNVMFAGIYAK